jgi:hypothetical protein
MILDIQTWWQDLEGIQKIYWVIALIFSALFVTQIILSFASGDADAMGDADVSVDADEGIGSQYFTFKNMVAFFTMFGWVGIAGTNAGWNPAVTMIAGIMAGVAVVAMLVFMLNKMMKLQQSGTLDINNALHQTGNTYLFIPAGRKGVGKVQLKVQGSVRELDAMTDDDEDIPSGRPVKVTGIIGNDLLLVSKNLN